LPRIARDIFRFVIFLGAGLGILYWIFSRQERMYTEDCVLKGIPLDECNLWDKIQADFLSVDPFWIFLVILAFMLSNLSRAHRWQMLMRGIGMRTHFSNAFLTIMFGYMANLAVPRLGEVLRGTALARYEQQPVEKILGTIVVDRVVDVLSLLFAIILAFVLQFNVIYGFLIDNFGESRMAGRFIWIAGGVFLLGVALLWFLRRRLKRTSLYQRFQKIISGFAEGLRSLRTVDNKPLFIFHTVAIWVLYYSMMILCFQAFEPTNGLGLLPGLMVFVFGGLGIVFPSPGGMGTYHAMVMAALALYGIAEVDSFSFANIMYFSVQIFCNILFGVLAVILLPILNRKRNADIRQDQELGASESVL
jgi:uncharacterized membrane protein YbhN (UPF0104 family)